MLPNSLNSSLNSTPIRCCLQGRRIKKREERCSTVLGEQVGSGDFYVFHYFCSTSFLPNLIRSPNVSIRGSVSHKYYLNVCLHFSHTHVVSSHLYGPYVFVWSNPVSADDLFGHCRLLSDCIDNTRKKKEKNNSSEAISAIHSFLPRVT